MASKAPELVAASLYERDVQAHMPAEALARSSQRQRRVVQRTQVMLEALLARESLRTELSVVRAKAQHRALPDADRGRAVPPQLSAEHSKHLERYESLSGHPFPAGRIDATAS